MDEKKLKDILAMNDNDFMLSTDKVEEWILSSMKAGNYAIDGEGYKAFKKNSHVETLLDAFADKLSNATAKPLENTPKDNSIDLDKTQELKQMADVNAKPVEIEKKEVEKPLADNIKYNYGYKAPKKHPLMKKIARYATTIGLAIGVVVGVSSCKTANKTAPTASIDSGSKDSDDLYFGSMYAKNADNMVSYAADILNQTRPYGNNATSKEMLEFMLAANYKDVTKDPQFLHNLFLNMSVDDEKEFVENFMGESDLNKLPLNENLSQDQLNQIFNQKGAMNNLILSYSMQIEDTDAINNKKLSNYYPLFIDENDSKYINDLMNRINDAVYNFSDSQKVTADLEEAAQLVTDGIQNENIGYGAKYTSITLFNDIINSKFAHMIDDNIEKALTVCKGNMDMSENASNVAFKTRQEIDSLLLSLGSKVNGQAGSVVDMYGVQTKSANDYIKEMDALVNAKYLSGIIKVTDAKASLDDTTAGAYIDNNVSTSTWTTNKTSASTTTFDATTPEQAQAKASVEATNADTEKKTEEAAEGKAVTSTSGQTSGASTGTNASTDSNGNGTINTTGSQPVDIKNTDTADDINKKIADSTNTTVDDVQKQIVYDANGNVISGNIGTVIVNGNKQVEEAQAKAAADMAAQGYTNIVGSNQAALSQDGTAKTLK